MDAAAPDDTLAARLTWAVCVLLPHLVDGVTAAHSPRNAAVVTALAHQLRRCPPGPAPGPALDLLKDLCRLLAHPHPHDTWDTSADVPDPRTRLHLVAVTVTEALRAWYSWHAHGAPHPPPGRRDHHDAVVLLGSSLAQARSLVDDPYWVLCLRIVHAGLDPARADATARAALA